MRARFLPFLLFGALLAGCVADLPLPRVGAAARLVLLGELVAGDTLSLRLGQSTPVAQGNVPQMPDAGGLTVSFSKENLLLATLYPQEDDRSRSLKTLLIASARRLYAGAAYQVRIAGGSYPEVTAVVDMPRPFAAAIIDTATARYAGATVLRMVLRIYDRPGEANYYSVEALRQSFQLSGTFQYGGGTYDLVRDKLLYDSLRVAGIPPPKTIDTTYSPLYERLPVYTDDALTENLKLATPYTTARRVLLTDNTFEGGVHDLKIFVVKDRFYGSFPNDLGRILFSIKSTTAPYFKYLRAYETFAPATSTGYLAQPVQIESNVKGGLGVVGGSFRMPFYYIFDSNPF